MTSRSTIVQTALNELGFHRYPGNPKGFSYVRDNDTRLSRLKLFLSNKLESLIHTETKFKYISIPEVRKYCESNDIIFNPCTVSDYIKNDLGFVQKQHPELQQKTGARRLWVKSF